MNKIVAIPLACLIIIVSTKETATYLMFTINQSYIAKNWCINKDKPTLNCKGKCYLNKKVKENENRDDKLPISQEDKPVFMSFLSLNDNKINSFENESTILFDYHHLISQSTLSDVFRPPKFETFLF